MEKRRVAIEGEEPDAGVARVVVDVGAEVQFVEPREPRQRRKADGADALHEKRNDAEVGLAREGIDVKSGGEVCGDHFRFGLPVEKAEAGPALFHHRETCGSLRLGEALLFGGHFF